ncbi:MAG: hypothetical protein ACETV0_03460 [Nitrososphaeria archaeon]
MRTEFDIDLHTRRQGRPTCLDALLDTVEEYSSDGLSANFRASIEKASSE